MVIAWLTGGLGNQLFIYAAARNYSLRNNIKLKFDSSNFSHDFRKLELNKFNVLYKEASFMEKILFRKKIQKYILRISMRIKYLPIIILESKKEYDSAFFGNRRNCYLQGYWQKNVYNLNILSLLRSEFTLKEEFKSNEYYDLKANISVSNSVSIHIRRSDYLDEKNISYFHTLTINYYERAIEKIKGSVNNLKYFVFTDDLNWTLKNFSHIDNIVFVSDIIKDAAQEFELMKLCKYNIIANSTFSWWAANLNAFENKIVIIPKLFYKVNKMQLEYQENKLFYIENSFVIDN